MHAHILTLFPEVCAGPLSVGPTKRARDIGVLDVSLHQIRDRTTDRHRSVDDVPYGGGSGMVLMAEPVVATLEAVMALGPVRRVLLSASGRRFTHEDAVALAAEPAIALVCGRYEGVDDRVRHWVDDEVSIGDYVLSGGELPALVVLDAIARLLPGAVGNAESVADESYGTGLLEYPQYTRPASFRGHDVPDVLQSGDHGGIARWRRRAALARTLERRPDLLRTAPLDADDRTHLHTLGWTEEDDGDG